MDGPRKIPEEVKDHIRAIIDLCGTYPNWVREDDDCYKLIEKIDEEAHKALYGPDNEDK